MLEGLSFVDAVYAVDANALHVACDYVVELRPYSGAFLAEVHFALREVLDHEADARVLIRDAALLPAPAFVAL